MNHDDLMLVREKHAQLDGLLPTLPADAWLILTREHSDAATELVTGGHGMIGEAAFLFTKAGRKIALVADIDAVPIELPGVFDRVLTYGFGGFGAPLAALLQEIAPVTLALNYSDGDPLADGLTVGMLRKLQAAWQVPDLEARMRSAETLVGDLRALKSAEEIRRLRQAVRVTETVLDEVGAFLRPGQSEIEVTEFVKQRQRHHGVTASFGDGAHVMVGHAGMGHRPASEARLTPGDTVVIDIGVYVQGYTSDIMRTWYVRREDEATAPPEVRHRFEIGRDAMRHVFGAMRPGVRGFELDRVAREHQASQGIEPYGHALGHQIGRSVHDGGTILAPLNTLYGELGRPAVRAREVYTVEPVVHGRTGVNGVPVGHEQDALVTEDGCELLSTPPSEIDLV